MTVRWPFLKGSEGRPSITEPPNSSCFCNESFGKRRAEEALRNDRVEDGDYRLRPCEVYERFNKWPSLKRAASMRIIASTSIK